MNDFKYKYSRILKRNLRLSGRFRNNRNINIITLKNNITLEFSKEVIYNIISKNNLKINVSYIILNDINKFSRYISESGEDYLVILPSEAVATLFILNISNIFKNKLFLKYSKNYYNIAYEISEYWLSKHYNKDYEYIIEDYREIEDLVLLNTKKDEKYIKGFINSIKYLYEKGII